MLRALEPLLLAHLTLTILKIEFQMRKLCPSQIKGTQKKKSSNTTKTSSQKPKKVVLLLKFKDDL